MYSLSLSHLCSKLRWQHHCTEHKLRSSSNEMAFATGVQQENDSVKWWAYCFYKGRGRHLFNMLWPNVNGKRTYCTAAVARTEVPITHDVMLGVGRVMPDYPQFGNNYSNHTKLYNLIMPHFKAFRWISLFGSEKTLLTVWFSTNFHIVYENNECMDIF